MEEMEEVMGDKPDIEADDLEKLTYMTQVWTTVDAEIFVVI